LRRRRSLGFPLTGQCERPGPRRDCHLAEDVVLLSPVEEITVSRTLVFAADVTCLDTDNAVRFRESVRIYQQRVDGTEDGGVRADPDGKRQQGDGSKCRTLAEHAEAIAYVPHQEIEKIQPARVPTLLFDLIESAKHEPGASIRLLPRQARIHVLVGLQINMTAQLLVQLCLYNL